MFVIDTNVLVYAADRDSEFHRPCLELLEGWRRQAGAWYTTWSILYEFLRVTTHSRVFRTPWPAPQAWAYVEAVLGSPGLGILTAGDRHSMVAGQVMRELPHLRGNLMHDAQIAVLMREHGVRRIYTRDTDFHRFPFLEAIDPLA